MFRFPSWSQTEEIKPTAAETISHFSHNQSSPLIQQPFFSCFFFLGSSLGWGFWAAAGGEPEAGAADALGGAGFEPASAPASPVGMATSRTAGRTTAETVHTIWSSQSSPVQSGPVVDQLNDPERFYLLRQWEDGCLKQTL